MKLENLLLESTWKELLLEEFQKEYIHDLSCFLSKEYAEGKTIYPKTEHYFSALNKLSFEQVRVVILGQDPYHGPEQAQGLSFSVTQGQRIPPSLRNIFKELNNDLGVMPPVSGDLSSWAEQGVLLLNNVLSVEQGKANSHKGKGWERFTDKIIELLNQQGQHIVFMLWGRDAQFKGSAIDISKHLVLSAVHPSPLSAYRGFFGCKHFSSANEYLLKHHGKPIAW